MSSIFSKIIKGEIPCYKVAEDEAFFAFLDIHPLARGHTLVVSKKEIDYYFDLEDELFTAMNLFARKVARAIEKSVDCKRIGVVVMGLEVAHAHIHLVPLNDEGDLNFANPKVELSKEEYEEIARTISSNL
ncbi:MAG: HIT family protein [Bacteroidales bacterium]|jgi:histidine triad (HIT) family protein|nr:HIT family protein [Bacteroidales bacterium]